MIEIISPGSCFYGTRMTLFSLSVAVLPARVHQQNLTSRSAFCSTLSRWKSQARVGFWRVASPYLRGLLLLSVFAWVTYVALVPQLSLPALSISPIPWNLEVRTAEASHPGPAWSLGTLNVASLSRHNEVVVLPLHAPLTLVIKETCLTPDSFSLVRGKATFANRNFVASCLNQPRKSALRKDSILRGQSGGVAVSSDAPCRRSSMQMPMESWLSTRLVECIIPVGHNISARVIGICGHCGTYESPSIMDGLLNPLLDHVLVSCFVVGGFNCPLEELSFWPTLKALGWKDANSLAYDLFATPIRPTWKGKTRIDFVLIPPQFVGLFTYFHHTDDAVSDHSFIAAEFKLPDSAHKLLNWRPCKDIQSLGQDLCKVMVEQPRSLFADGKMDEAMQEFTHKFEQSAKEILKSFHHVQPNAFLGRSKPP